MSHLSIILQTIRDCQLFSKFSKYEFLLRFIAFIGHIVYGYYSIVNPKKPEVMMNWFRPLTPSNIWSRLDLGLL